MSFGWSFLFICAGLLAFLPDFLPTGMFLSLEEVILEYQLALLDLSSFQGPVLRDYFKQIPEEAKVYSLRFKTVIYFFLYSLLSGC